MKSNPLLDVLCLTESSFYFLYYFETLRIGRFDAKMIQSLWRVIIYPIFSDLNFF